MLLDLAIIAAVVAVNAAFFVLTTRVRSSDESGRAQVTCRCGYQTDRGWVSTPFVRLLADTEGVALRCRLPLFTFDHALTWAQVERTKAWGTWPFGRLEIHQRTLGRPRIHSISVSNVAALASAIDGLRGSAGTDRADEDAPRRW